MNERIKWLEDKFLADYLRLTGTIIPEYKFGIKVQQCFQDLFEANHGFDVIPNSKQFAKNSDFSIVSNGRIYVLDPKGINDWSRRLMVTKPSPEVIYPLGFWHEKDQETQPLGWAFGSEIKTQWLLFGKTKFVREINDLRSMESLVEMLRGNNAP